MCQAMPEPTASEGHDRYAIHQSRSYRVLLLRDQQQCSVSRDTCVVCDHMHLLWKVLPFTPSHRYYAFLKPLQVPVAGIFINKVGPSKLKMVEHYMGIAAKQLGTPLLGCIPYSAGFDSPSCVDLENLFGEKMISKRDDALRRFSSYELVSKSVIQLQQKGVSSMLTCSQHGAFACGTNMIQIWR